MVFRGLKFLSDEEIGEKGSFRSGTTYANDTVVAVGSQESLVKVREFLNP